MGLQFHDVATPHWFMDDPCLAWGFYGHRQQLYSRAAPHGGYYALLRLMARATARSGSGPRGFVFTSNVDGAWATAQAAAVREGSAADGCGLAGVYEVHGNINYLQCTSAECRPRVWEDAPALARVSVDVAGGSFRCTEATLPKCVCGAIARPNVMMFDDADFLWHRASVQEDAMKVWLADVRRAGLQLCVIDIGSGVAVPTCRRQAEHVADSYEASIIRINVREPEFDRLPAPYTASNGASIDLPARLALEEIERLVRDLDAKAATAAPRVV